MVSSGFTIYLIFIGALVLAMTGVVLLIIGLVQKTKPLWISGVISFALAIVLFLSAFFFGIYKFFSMVEKAAKLNYHYFEYKKYNVPNYESFQDSTEISLDSLYSKPITGIINGENYSEVFVKVFPIKSITDKEIDIVKIEKSSKNRPNTICLLFSFEQKYSGNFTLKAYDSSNTLLNSSKVMVHMNPKMENTIEFVFPKGTNFSIISYLTLEES